VARAARNVQVLGSAAELFAAKGFAATSVSKVANGARLTKAGLYYHIRDKEDLLYRICNESISTILTGARRVLSGKASPRERIAGLIANHAEFFRAHPNNLTVLNRDLNSPSLGPRATIRKLERAYLALLRGAIFEGQKAGQIHRQFDPTVAAFTILASLNSLYQWYDPKGRIPYAATVKQITMLSCNGLFVAGAD
jgi:TetR/AcrR family transcriptional regulator, cholesterol catabolism regulator